MSSLNQKFSEHIEDIVGLSEALSGIPRRPGSSRTQRLENPRRQPITIYTTPWCGDRQRGRQFLGERGVLCREANIEKTPDAEEVALRVNEGRRIVPTFKVGGRYFACSPFDAYQHSEELHVPLNPEATASKKNSAFPR